MGHPAPDAIWQSACTVLEVQNDMTARPIYTDVDGAQFGIGERVGVGDSKDETFDRSFKGRVGSVKYFEYDCGCGQSFPRDPMIGVRFRNDDIEEFWAEELTQEHQCVRGIR